MAHCHVKVALCLCSVMLRTNLLNARTIGHVLKICGTFWPCRHLCSNHAAAMLDVMVESTKPKRNCDVTARPLNVPRCTVHCAGAMHSVRPHEIRQHSVLSPWLKVASVMLCVTCYRVYGQARCADVGLCDLAIKCVALCLQTGSASQT